MCFMNKFARSFFAKTQQKYFFMCSTKMFKRNKIRYKYDESYFRCIPVPEISFRQDNKLTSEISLLFQDLNISLVRYSWVVKMKTLLVIWLRENIMWDFKQQYYFLSKNKNYYLSCLDYRLIRKFFREYCKSII